MNQQIIDKLNTHDLGALLGLEKTITSTLENGNLEEHHKQELEELREEVKNVINNLLNKGVK